MTISPELYDFYVDWLAWVDRGAPDMEPYDRSVGLCPSLDWYIGHAGAPDWLRMEQGDLFELDERDPNYPFGEREYWEHAKGCSQHLDPARLAWVREHIAEYEEDRVRLDAPAVGRERWREEETDK